MCIFHGYNPFSHHGPLPEEDTKIPEHIAKKALDAGATYIAKDGKKAYKKLFGIVQYADWDGKEYGSWWDTQQDTFPEGATEIK